MKKVLIFIYTSLILTISNAQTIENLKCEYEINPFGIENTKPHFSWSIKSATRGTKQNAYQILVADNEADLKKDNGNVWNSGMVKSDQSISIEYAGKPLESRKRYFWKVKIWNEKNKQTPYGETSRWEMALLQKSDWTAHWIGKNSTEGKVGTPAKSIELQKEFKLDKRAVRTRIYVTGLGAYHLIFNGKKVGQDLLTPGNSDYTKSINYQIYEISNDELSIGTNFITATLGNAWWGSEIDWGNGKSFFSNGSCRILFQMEMEFYDGSRQTVISDGSWKTRLSPIVANTIYSGEVYNAQLEYGKDWENAAIMDDVENKTSNNETVTTKNIELKAQIEPQIKIVKELKAIKITEPKKGRFVFDFGENVVGFTYLQVEGKAGKEVEMKFSEKITDKGLVEQTGSIRPYDKYILKGYGVEKWEPKFTYHGFRYVEVEGLPKKPDVNTLVAKVIYSNQPFVENFAYSKDILEKLYIKKEIKKPILDQTKIVIIPEPKETSTSEEKKYSSNYGEVNTKWEQKGNKFAMKISVPVNLTVQIELPLQTGKTINNIKESGKPFILKKKPVKIEGITYLKTEKNKAIFEVGSGNYDFVIE